MAKWLTPLWMSTLCLVTACGPTISQADTPSSIDDSSKPAATAATQSPPLSSQAPPSAPTTVNQQDTTIIPGERVGPVTSTTSRAELAKMYGEAALTDTEIPVGEGFTEWGTEVNAGSDQAFSVIWVDRTQDRPATVKDFGAAWQTPEGLQIGTPFSEVQNTLGTFDLYGFGWDYGGTVVLESSDLSNYYGTLILRLQPTDSATLQQQPEAFQAVQGDQLIASDNPNLPPLDLEVGEMIVYLNSPVE